MTIIGDRHVGIRASQHVWSRHDMSWRAKWNISFKAQRTRKKNANLVLHYFLHNVEHSSRGWKDEASVMLCSQIVHQRDQKPHLARLSYQKCVRDVVDVKRRRVLGNSGVQQIDVHATYTDNQTLRTQTTRLVTLWSVTICIKEVTGYVDSIKESIWSTFAQSMSYFRFYFLDFTSVLFCFYILYF